MVKARKIVTSANEFIKELDKILKRNDMLTVKECKALARVDKKMSNFWYQTLEDHLNNMGDLRHQKAVVENMIRIIGKQTMGGKRGRNINTKTKD